MDHKPFDKDKFIQIVPVYNPARGEIEFYALSADGDLWHYTDYLSKWEKLPMNKE